MFGGPLKRLVVLKSDEPAMQKMVNDLIRNEQVKIVDFAMLQWNKHERMYQLVVVVEEQERFFRQNCLVLENRDPEIIVKDLDDFSAVMAAAKNVPYNIISVKMFTISPPTGRRYLCYVVYED
ncbi:MAG: hypothetical protein ACM3QZ_05400 [Solirubrobacterales bacterium]